MEQESFKKGVFYIGFCAFLWSLGGLFIKLIDWHPMAIASVRSLIAGLFIIVSRRISGRREKLVFHPRQFPAALSYASCMILFVAANKLTTAANAILLQYTAPVYVALLAWFFLDEKPRWDNLLALICVMGGMVLFFLDDLEAGSRLGNYLGLVSGITFALFTVFMRKQKSSSTVESMLLAQFLTFAAGLPFIFMAKPFPDMAGTASLLGLGVLQMGVASLFFSAGIKHIPAIIAVLIVVIEPLLNPLWVFLVTGEKPGMWAMTGGIIIVVSVTGSSLLSSRRQGA